jgi:hypothetical protein
MGDLGTCIGSRELLLRALHRRQDHIDRHITVCVAVDLDTRTVHALIPGVQVGLRFRDVAFVRRCDPGIRRAQCHRALGERPVHRVLGGGSEPDPLVAEAGLNAGVDHCLQHSAVGLIAHPVQQVSARPHLL